MTHISSISLRVITRCFFSDADTAETKLQIASDWDRLVKGFIQRAKQALMQLETASRLLSKLYVFKLIS